MATQNDSLKLQQMMSKIPSEDVGKLREASPNTIGNGTIKTKDNFLRVTSMPVSNSSGEEAEAYPKPETLNPKLKLETLETLDHRP